MFGLFYFYLTWNDKEYYLFSVDKYALLQMFAFIKKFIKWGSSKNTDSKKDKSYHILGVLRGLLEDVLFWKRMWLSLTFVFLLNFIFLLIIHKDISFFELILYIYISVLIIDAFETWLKYKHRTSYLKRLSVHDGSRLIIVTMKLKTMVGKKWLEFMYLRENNHTKAFLLMNILFGILFITGKYISGYLLLYMVCMFLCLFHKVAPPVISLVKKIQQNAESDVEFEGLIPEVSDIDINLLSIEPESSKTIDDRQSLDYWKPDDLPLEEASDSSDNSSSLTTNLSMEKMHTLNRDVETSDSSEDEYIPLEQQKEQLQSTLEVIQPAATWSTSAYNALWNLTGTVANMVYTKTEDNKRKRVSSVDSSDGFEIVEKQDLL